MLYRGVCTILSCYINFVCDCNDGLYDRGVSVCSSLVYVCVCVCVCVCLSTMYTCMCVCMFIAPSCVGLSMTLVQCIQAWLCAVGFIIIVLTQCIHYVRKFIGCMMDGFLLFMQDVPSVSQLH